MEIFQRAAKRCSNKLERDVRSASWKGVRQRRVPFPRTSLPTDVYPERIVCVPDTRPWEDLFVWMLSFAIRGASVIQEPCRARNLSKQPRRSELFIAARFCAHEVKRGCSSGVERTVSGGVVVGFCFFAFFVCTSSSLHFLSNVIGAERLCDQDAYVLMICNAMKLRMGEYSEIRVPFAKFFGGCQFLVPRTWRYFEFFVFSCRSRRGRHR